MAVSVNWFYLRGVEGVSFETPEQFNGRLKVDFFIPQAANLNQTGPIPGKAQRTSWDSGFPSLPPLVRAALHPSQRSHVSYLIRQERVQ